MAPMFEHNDDLESPPAEKPFHSKRPHRKSRAGCRNCKTRKVKCDEARPTCRACKMRRETCLYPTSPPGSTSGVVTTVSSRRATQGTSRDLVQPTVLGEPLFITVGNDLTDMKLLWFYSIKTFSSFSGDESRDTIIDHILKVTIVQHAFQAPFLMDTVLGLSAAHMNSVTGEIPSTKALSYRGRALEGYRRAIAEAKRETFPALLAASLLLCALSSETFRTTDCKPLYILDWMTVWRGIILIIDLIQPDMLFQSGMAPLFFRPPINLETAALAVPSNLLFMVSEIRDGDEDFEHITVYYTTLKILGSLYEELYDGFSPILDLRIITFFTSVPQEFVVLAQKRRPRALIIIAYYLVFIKILNGTWWMSGISDKEIVNISDAIGDAWSSFLRVPRLALAITDANNIGKLLLNNHSWEPTILEESEVDRERKAKDPSWVSDTGQMIEYAGHLVYKIPMRHRREAMRGPLEPPDGFTGGSVLFTEDDSMSTSSGISPAAT